MGSDTKQLHKTATTMMGTAQQQRKQNVPRSPVAPASAAQANREFLRDIVAGLASSPKTLPCKYFYDDRGSKLFERICDTPEYYITRTEIAMLQAIGAEIADYLGPGCEIVELGCGAGIKVQLLIDALIAADRAPRSFTMIDIAEETLLRAARLLDERYPTLEVVPAVADYIQETGIPAASGHSGRHKKLVFFPGSSVGNFDPVAAGQFLSRIRSGLDKGDALLIGVDLIKPERVLNAAYNDDAGITAEFNLNLLRRIRDAFDTDLDPDAFRHRAFYNAAQHRIEMHLVSQKAQAVSIEGQRFAFVRGETIHTENSYKYSIEDFQRLGCANGFRLRRTWTDPDAYFSLHYFEV